MSSLLYSRSPHSLCMRASFKYAWTHELWQITKLATDWSNSTVLISNKPELHSIYIHLHAALAAPKTRRNKFQVISCKFSKRTLERANFEPKLKYSYDGWIIYHAIRPLITWITRYFAVMDKRCVFVYLFAMRFSGSLRIEFEWLWLVKNRTITVL